MNCPRVLQVRDRETGETVKALDVTGMYEWHVRMHKNRLAEIYSEFDGKHFITDSADEPTPEQLKGRGRE